MKRNRKHTHNSFLDCDKESKIKGCQQTSAPENLPRFEAILYMKIIWEAKSKTPLSGPLRSTSCCENLFKQAMVCCFSSSFSPLVCETYKKSSSHLFVLGRAVYFISCGNVRGFALFYINAKEEKSWAFLSFINSRRVINCDSVALCCYLFICFMSNANRLRWPQRCDHRFMIINILEPELCKWRDHDKVPLALVLT